MVLRLTLRQNAVMGRHPYSHGFAQKRNAFRLHGTVTLCLNLQPHSKNQSNTRVLNCHAPWRTSCYQGQAILCKKANPHFYFSVRTLSILLKTVKLKHKV